MEGFALQDASKYGTAAPASMSTAPAVMADMVLMDFNTLRIEILATVQEESKSWRGKERGDGKCWACGGTGHFHRNCPSKKAEGKEVGKEETR
jgi:hypothetical protein